MKYSIIDERCGKIELTDGTKRVFWNAIIDLEDGSIFEMDGNQATYTGQATPEELELFTGESFGGEIIWDGHNHVLAIQD